MNGIGIQALDPRTILEWGRGALGAPCPPQAPFSPTRLCRYVDAQGSCPSLYPALSKSDCGFPKKGLQRGVGGFRTRQDGSEVGFQTGEPGWGHLWPKPLPRGPASHLGLRAEIAQDPVATGPKPEQAPGAYLGS